MSQAQDAIFNHRTSRDRNSELMPPTRHRCVQIWQQIVQLPSICTRIHHLIQPQEIHVAFSFQ
ncbi:hypothetical protein RE6C_02218 [Rhodopirellula europaea 6C]|uniref:Uncharacterized protein n=1 Tax=Rhodopirellula europaea 6C TaxID=1263867 RepID=M2AWJ9_9BACT|nr:hypothetical protein RE6C_02218 [Rhodopirellula europaea 6C]